jgi:hypothetical protein
MLEASALLLALVGLIRRSRAELANLLLPLRGADA